MICLFDNTINKHDYDGGKNCINKFCKDLKKKLKKVNHIINKIFVLYTKKNLVQMMTIKSIIEREREREKERERERERERDHCHYTGKYRGICDNVYNLRYKNQKKISVVFHNGSTYNYHFVILEQLRILNLPEKIQKSI